METTVHQRKPTAAKAEAPTTHSPSADAAGKKSPVFAPLSVPLERRKQTLAIGAWLSLFFGSLVCLLVIVVVWGYLAYSTLARSYAIYRTVYAETAYYGSEADRLELAPKLLDHMDGGFLLTASEFLVLSVLILTVGRSWKNLAWNTAHRRLFPTKVLNRQFSREHELITDTWLGALVVRVYTSWSRHLTGFFPHKVIFDDTSLDEDQIHDLFPEDKNYIFACHPHGMASVAVWSTFCWRPTLSTDPKTRASSSFVNADTPMRRFLEKYVVYGVDFGKSLKHKTAQELHDHKRKAYGVVVHTLDPNFIQPFWRELILRVGLRDVCRRAILNSVGPVEADTLPLADRREKGHLSRISCIVVGGAAESVDFDRPGRLTLKKRKGFIKICVETGSAVVPVYSFGENDLYEEFGTPIAKRHNNATNDPLPKRINRKMQKILGFALPLARGRGFFNYSFGFIPHRRQMTTVVGKPIFVKQVARPKKGVVDPTQQAAFDAEVDRAHQEYIAALSKLYRSHQPILDPECPVKDIELR